MPINSVVFALLIAKPVIERVEKNTTSPFTAFREKSVQRFIFTKKAPYLVTEFNYKHATYKDMFGDAPSRNMLFEASLRGINLSGGQDFHVGRIWTGNDLLQPVDGLSWYSPWGDRLSTSFQFGQFSKIDFDEKASKPSFAEGRLQYKLNKNAFMAVQSSKNYDKDFGSFMTGYNSKKLKTFAEYRTGNSTDTAHLALQYYDGSKFDITSNYYLNRNDGQDSAVSRNYLGVSMGNIYLEVGAGGVFFFGDQLATNDSSFTEGSLDWDVTGKDRLTCGYSLETLPASSSRTLSAMAERKVSSRTSFSLGVENTTYDNGVGSIQNYEGTFKRYVDWGYFELRGAVISGGEDSDLQKDISLKAGYEF